jgi:iduronate 2-sulfatase
LLFKNNGFYTVGVGKVFHNAWRDNPIWWDKSFNTNTFSVGPYVNEINAAEYASNRTGPAIENEDVEDFAYLDGKIAVKALEELELAENRFFMAVGFLKPHLPFASPEKYKLLYKNTSIVASNIKEPPAGAPSYAINTDEVRPHTDIPSEGELSDELSRELKLSYFACISYIDHQIGMILKKVKDLGLDRNTIIILTSDHGFKLGEYGVWGKHSNFEFDTRVPLLIYHPDYSPQKNTNIVELIDLYPTIASLANVEVNQTNGQDLSGIISGTNNVNLRNAAMSQYYIKKDNVMGYSIRKDNIRYTTWINNRIIIAEEFYDHSSDPNETINAILKLSKGKRLEYVGIINTLSGKEVIDPSPIALPVPKNSLIRVYPNPTTDKLIIELNREINILDISLNLFNSSGETISFTSNKYNNTIEIEFKAKGLILYSIESNGENLCSGKILSK